jgi:hypothetical protein
VPKLPYPDETMPYPAAPPPWDEGVTGLPSPFRDNGTSRSNDGERLGVTPDPKPRPAD